MICYALCIVVYEMNYRSLHSYVSNYVIAAFYWIILISYVGAHSFIKNDMTTCMYSVCGLYGYYCLVYLDL